MSATYGYCPTCGAPGADRERRPNGNDHCHNGHYYPSKDALKEPPAEKTGWEHLPMAEQQRRSFVYGNLKLSNPAITRRDIDRACEVIAKERAIPSTVIDENGLMLEGRWAHGPEESYFILTEGARQARVAAMKEKFPCLI